jgi:hypothetical protein
MPTECIHSVTDPTCLRCAERNLGAAIQRIADLEYQLAEAKADSESLSRDMDWRRRWHDRLGRGTQTEGRFYEKLEQVEAERDFLREANITASKDMDGCIREAESRNVGISTTTVRLWRAILTQKEKNND